MAVRLLFFLLVFANLLWFAWSQGYFGLPDDGHEPQRLAQQLHPEKLRITRAEVTPADAQPEEIACRLVSGLATTDAEALTSAVAAVGAKTRIVPLPMPPTHLVIIADLASKAAADKKATELGRLGVEMQNITALEGERHEIVLGSFKTEAAAQEYLQRIARRGVRTARMETREQATEKVSLEARAPASVLLPQLPKLIKSYADATIGECSN